MSGIARSLTIAALGSGCGMARVQSVLEVEGDRAAGAQVYEASCASCHRRPDWATAYGCNLYMKEVDLGTVDEPAIVRQVLYGSRCMPALGEDLTDEQIADVTAYVLSLDDF
jgi:mono/diheme cytochrome c family protein